MDGRRNERSDEAGARRGRGALEAEVMAALWAAAGPVSGAQVHEVIGGGLHYKTVLTVLSRLCEKGLVQRRPGGRGFVYSPRQVEADLVAEQMRAALSRAGDHGAVLQRFLAVLDPADEAELRSLLGEAE